MTRMIVSSIVKEGNQNKIVKVPIAGLARSVDKLFTHIIYV